MSTTCDPANHNFDLHRERDLLWCAKCGTTKSLDEPQTGMVFNVTVLSAPRDFKAFSKKIGDLPRAGA